ncbi:DUF5134 domain-containing protein [Streptomyces sp. ODS05-4]|uniref:DUF5134 domain-containing protein n=1 Tax=Streptomyces sp. ODS05-4 TaxID=2944939 RepID=UPI00210D7171|nr:DUF5134 domain-containing protein [Streptomyces sp. ODS05-4]
MLAPTLLGLVLLLVAMFGVSCAVGHAVGPVVPGMHVSGSSGGGGGHGGEPDPGDIEMDHGSGRLWALFDMPACAALWLATTPGRTVADRVGNALHAVMEAAMAWPWGMDLPACPQMVVFSAAALWFAGAAFAAPRERRPARRRW